MPKRRLSDDADEPNASGHVPPQAKRPRSDDGQEFPDAGDVASGTGDAGTQADSSLVAGAGLPSEAVESSSPSSDDDVASDSDIDGPPVEKKVLPQRLTRGQRSLRLVGEALEADEAFWNQDAFQSDDSEFSLESEADTNTESTDSDIDLPEPEDEEDDGGKGSRKRAGAAAAGSSSSSHGGVTVDDDDGGGGVKKRGAGGAYTDKAAVALKATSGSLGQMVANALEKGRKRTGVRDAALLASSGLNAEEIQAAIDAGEGGALLRGIRARRAGAADSGSAAGFLSTSGVAAAAEKSVDKARAEVPKEPRLTQAQVLVDAARTALENERLLAHAVLRSQAAAAAGLTADSGKIGGVGHVLRQGTPALRLLSRRGCPDILTFTEVDDFPSVIQATAHPDACECPDWRRQALARSKWTQKHTILVSRAVVTAVLVSFVLRLPSSCADARPKVCAVTGKRAEYQAPGGVPYCDSAAFRGISAASAQRRPT
jgi:hypothetical protein